MTQQATLLNPIRHYQLEPTNVVCISTDSQVKIKYRKTYDSEERTSMIQTAGLEMGSVSAKGQLTDVEQRVPRLFSWESSWCERTAWDQRSS